MAKADVNALFNAFMNTVIGYVIVAGTDAVTTELALATVYASAETAQRDARLAVTDGLEPLKAGYTIEPVLVANIFGSVDKLPEACLLAFEPAAYDRMYCVFREHQRPRMPMLAGLPVPSPALVDEDGLVYVDMRVWATANIPADDVKDRAVGSGKWQHGRN